jgi:DNA-binding IclR family transcriptional regulator
MNGILGTSGRRAKRSFIDWNNRGSPAMTSTALTSPPSAGPAGTSPAATSTALPRGRRPTRGEPVLDRAFRILAAFGPEQRSLSLTSLSTRAGLPKPTALRIARKLAEWGALERTGNGEYVIGLRLLEVASLAPRGHGLRTTALPYLEDLHHSTGQHVLLAVRDGTEAVLVERLSARAAGRVLYRVGGRMPLHSTGVGLILLAHAPPAVQEEVLCGDLGLEPAESIWPSGRDLRVTLAGIRRDGVAIACRQLPDPMTSVAAPITDGRGATVAALSVVTRSEQMEPAVLRPAVVAVARAISRVMSAAGG